MDHSFFQIGNPRHQHHQQMRQKPARDAFFSLKNEPQVHRPMSVATEFVDTDWDEEFFSEADDNSPRVSLQSSGQPSITTVSSYDEAPTPRSSSGQEAFVEASPKQVEGPRGPHLFRSSTDPSLLEEGPVLTLSPLTPKVLCGMEDVLERPQVRRRSSPFQYTHEELDTTALTSWTPEKVAQSMLNAGIEPSVTDRFIENDINGEILVTLRFEDLRELNIASFGIRTKVWHQIQTLRDSRPSSPRPPTLIEDVPSREARKETREVTLKESSTELRRHQSTKRRQRRRPSAHDDTVTPMDSVSIIGIEQLIPKPHHCSKGENCSKWKKQQRAIQGFRKANPYIDINAGGTVLIIGDAGNPETAKAIDPNETHRPVSDAIPSVVASSDILGPGGTPPLQYIQEAALRNVQSRDPHDHVRHFLTLQHHQSKGAEQVPPTPPFELTPAARPLHQGLSRLPKLSIPGNAVPQRDPPQLVEHQRKQQPSEPVPYRMEKATPMSPDLKNARKSKRFGSPFSELDVPVVAMSVGPVARDVSQSVPPDMGHRGLPSGSPSRPRSQSRASARRPSFPVLPIVDEHTPVRQAPRTTSPKTPSPTTAARPPREPLQAPPHFNYPWSPVDRTNFEHTIPPVSSFRRRGGSHEASALTKGITYQGPMKKRKMRLFRHEWHDGYFTLKGTRLNMHRDASDTDRTLEYVDIDDYAIACSSLASTSKLSAAFKAMHMSHSRGKSDPIAAFSFQLIPQDKEAGARLRKRDSCLNRPGTPPAEGVRGTGKTHHFAVKSRDDRIDWMRELMLAKALKQKGEGFEISVNGNMI